LNQEVINNLNRSITNNEVKTVTKNLQTKKCSGPDEFIAEFYQTFEELTPMLLKLFHKVQKERMLPNTFYEASIALISKPAKDTLKKKL
jgi:hypothetical protein